MKKIISGMLLAACIFVISCSKEKNTDPPTPEPGLAGLGYWTGTYAILGTSGPQNGALLVRPNGFLRYYEMLDKSDTTEIPDELKVNGNWTIAGETFKMTLVLSGQFISAKLKMNADGNYMSGPWSVDGDVVGNMKFEKE